MRRVLIFWPLAFSIMVIHFMDILNTSHMFLSMYIHTTRFIINKCDKVFCSTKWFYLYLSTNITKYNFEYLCGSPADIFWKQGTQCSRKLMAFVTSETRPIRGWSLVCFCKFFVPRWPKRRCQISFVLPLEHVVAAWAAPCPSIQFKLYMFPTFETVATILCFSPKSRRHECKCLS